MLRESVSSSPCVEDGGGRVARENIHSRSPLWPVWVSPESSIVHQQTPLSTPSTSSPACLPLLSRRRSKASEMVGHHGGGLHGTGSSASSQPRLEGSRFSLSLPRAWGSRSTLFLPLSGVSQSPHVSQAQHSDIPIGPTFPPIMPASSSSATAAQVLMHAMVSSSSSRRRLRLVLGTFCILNAVTAFLFAWMMSTEQTSFALTAARRRWNLRERSNATCKAGAYYVIIGLMLLVDRLSCTIAVIVQLGVRFVRAGCSLILRWLLWCARVIPASRGRGLLLRRFVTRSAGALPENYRVLLQSNSLARPPRFPPSAAVPATGAARAPSSHRLLPRVAGIHLGSSLQGAQASSTLEAMADLERDRRPRTATASPPSIRLRSS